MSLLSMFDDRLLSDFIDGFYGYGNYSGRYWFVGMEEGGGNSFENIDRRIQDWHHRGRLELEDIVDFHAAIGADKFFGSHPKLQPTWNRLIRIMLSANGHKVVNAENT